MKLQLAIALGAILSLPACATVTRGTNTAWEVTSTPSGARVETSNGHMCAATPCSIKMPRRSEFVATLTLSGYQPATITVTNKIATGGGVAMAGNVLVGGIIGAGVDAGSGAMLDLTPNPAHIDLQTMEATASAYQAAPAAAAPAAAATTGARVETSAAPHQ